MEIPTKGFEGARVRCAKVRRATVRRATVRRATVRRATVRGSRVTRQEQEQFLKVLQAHAQTVAIAEACAATTRDLAAEVARGGAPNRSDLLNTVAQAERALTDLAAVREEVERVLATLGPG